MSKCVTCNQDKDKFSQDWEYQQCQSCSMKEECVDCGRTLEECEADEADCGQMNE